ncbi:tyrosine-protein kinase family protein [Deferrisoma camini]|uniref:tyrosine-protein kinase family protein n=1 Tax=Deferrisoma camini TaxID=1035120 RepID=UPI00046D6EC1|nr:hypothetical protein [Deferrisoma camini]
MSKILEALEKAAKEHPRLGRGSVLPFPAAFTRPHLSPRELRRHGWFSALPHSTRRVEPVRAIARRIAGAAAFPFRAVVTGVGPRCGTTTVSLNLGAELARIASGEVVWLGGAPGSPWLADLLHPWANRGLSDILYRGAPLCEVRISGPVPNLFLVPGNARKGCPEPVEPPLLAEALERISAGLAGSALVIDAPPLETCPSVVTEADAVVLVVRPGTPSKHLETAAELLDRVPVSAVLVNHLPLTAALRTGRAPARWGR